MQTHVVEENTRSWGRHTTTYELPTFRSLLEHDDLAPFVVLFLTHTHSILNAMGAFVMLADALCMGMLAVSADKLDGSPAAKGIDTAVMVIQQVSLFGEHGDNLRRY